MHVFGWLWRVPSATIGFGGGLSAPPSARATVTSYIAMGMLLATHIVIDIHILV